MTIIKLSASEISSLLCYPVKVNPSLNLFLSENVKKAIQTGSFLHVKLGYTNSQQFTRMYTVNGITVQITGVPDRIDYEKGIVEELKTFRNATSRNRNKKVAFVQLMVYEFLTGLERGKIILFDAKEGKIVEEIPVNYNPETFQKIIIRALKLKQIKEDFYELFERVQKEDL